MNDLARTLAERGIRIATTSDGQHRTTCPACSAQRKKARDPCLSVEVSENGTKARYLCHHCGMSGGAGGEVRDMRPRKTYRRPKPPVALTDRNGDEAMLSWFKARAIGDETVRAFGIHRARHWFPQFGEERDCLAFPYRWRGELTNVKYRARVTIDGKESKTFAQEKDAEPTLYNADEIQADELVIVEGEMDVLACWDAGLRSVVSLPNGAAKSVDLNGKRLDALEAHADTLADVKRVVIATDSDEPGAALAEALSLRFGRDRCWRVRWPDGVKDANEMLARDGADALRAAVSSAAPWPVDGVHQPHEFAGEVEDLYFGRVATPLSCGIRELDALWRIVPGTFNVITGIPNHGKSMFVDQVAVNLAQRSGWNFAVFSPEHSPARHLARLAEKLIGKPFDDGPTTRMTHRELREAIDWLDQRFTFIRATDAAPTIDWLIERFRWCAIRRGVNGIVIDPYNEIEASRSRDQTETEFVSLLISKLKRFAASHGATVFMVVHPTKLKRGDDGQEPVPTLYDLSGSAHWRNKADSGVVIHRDFAADRTCVYVRKIREQPSHGTIGTAELVFDHRLRRLVGIDAAEYRNHYDGAAS